MIKALVLVTTVILALHTNAFAQIVTEGLVSYWSLDKDTISGETVKDVWGENDGTINGDPEAVSGKIKEALEFNGDDYISLTPVDCLVDHSFTIQAWIKVSKLEQNAVLAQGDATSTNKYLHWGVFNDSLGTLRFYGDDLRAGSVSLEEWYHLVGVYDKAKTTALLYLNGEEVGVKADCAGLKSDVNNSALEIGANYGKASRANFFNGIIDEVGIYDKALGADEIQKNYKAEKGLLLSVNPTGKLALTWGKIKTSK